MAEFDNNKMVCIARKYLFRRGNTTFRRPTKLLMTFLSYFLIVLLIPTIIGSAAYFMAGSIIGDEVQNSRIEMLNQVSHAIDFRLEETQRLALQVSTNYSILAFLAANNPANEVDIYKALRAINELATFKNANSFIEDIYVYSINNDSIINSNSMYNTKFFYDNFYSYTKANYEQWKNNIINGIHYNTYLPAADMIENNIQKKRIITYVQSIPITERNISIGSVVVLIAEDKVKALFEDLSLEGTIFVLNKNGDRITETENPFNYYPEASLMGDDQDILYTTVNKNKLVVMYSTSPVTGWKYVSILSRDSFMTKANYIRNMTVIVVSTGLILGLIVAYVLSKKVYSPIGFISNILTLRANGKRMGKLSEFDFIKQSIADTVAENGDLEDENRRNEDFREKCTPYLVSNLLFKLVMHKGEDNVDLVSYLKSFDIVFPHDFFAVLLYHVDDSNEFVSGDTGEKWGQVKTVFALVTEKMKNQGNLTYMAELSRNDYFLIVNMSSTLSPKQVNETLYNLATESKALIETQCKIYLSVSISNAHLGIHRISEAFFEAQKAQDYRIVRGRCSIISFADVEWHNEKYYYPLELELQLINNVRIGNKEKCEEILQNTYNENFQNRKLPLNLAKCLFFDIMSTVIKVLDQYKISFTQIFVDDYNPVASITSCETVEEEFEQVRKIYSRICAYINKNKLSHNFVLVRSVKDYLLKNFCDNSLSQTMIAEHFSITTTYLSKIFKQETGQNMVDFINELRIEKAKKLLFETTVSLVQIAKMSGCTSDKMLIRIFKSYEGITPGKYRNSEDES